MRHFIVLIIAVLGCAVQALAAAPVEPTVPAGAESARTVSVPFNPPLDRPLRYRASRDVTRNGETVSVWSSDEYRFSRSGSGYRLDVRPLDGGMSSGDAATRSAYQRIARLAERPHVLLLDETGAIVGMEDEEAYWAETLRLVEQLIRQARTPSTPADQAAIATAMAMLRNTEPAGRLAAITEFAAPIVEFAAIELVLGEERANEVEIAGLAGMAMRQQVRVRPQRVEGGSLFIAVHGSIPHEELARAIERFIAQIPVTGQGHNNATERSAAVAQLREAQMTREIDADYEVALDSGLTRRFRSAERTDVRMGSLARSQRTNLLIEQLP